MGTNDFGIIRVTEEEEVRVTNGSEQSWIKSPKKEKQ